VPQAFPRPPQHDDHGSVTGGSPQTTSTVYNNMRQAASVVQPDNTTMSSTYLFSGELARTWGSRTYPVEYTYDYAGRMQAMKTWKNFAVKGS